MEKTKISETQRGQASLTCAPFFIDAISNVLKDKYENNKKQIHTI